MPPHPQTLILPTIHVSDCTCKVWTLLGALRDGWDMPHGWQRTVGCPQSPRQPRENRTLHVEGEKRTHIRPPRFSFAASLNEAIHTLSHASPHYPQEPCKQQRNLRPAPLFTMLNYSRNTCSVVSKGGGLRGLAHGTDRDGNAPLIPEASVSLPTATTHCPLLTCPAHSGRKSFAEVSAV